MKMVSTGIYLLKHHSLLLALTSCNPKCQLFNLINYKDPPLIVLILLYRSLGKWIDQHALNTLKHSMRILVCVYMLRILIEVRDLLGIRVVLRQTVANDFFGVCGVLDGAVFDAVGARRVVEGVVLTAGDNVQGSEGKALVDGVVGDVQEKHPDGIIIIITNGFTSHQEIIVKYLAHGHKCQDGHNFHGSAYPKQ